MAAPGLAEIGGCRTHDMKLLGAEAYVETGASELERAYGLPEDVAEHLHHAYGDRAAQVAEIAREMGLATRLAEAHPYIEAEILYGARFEAALRAVDILCRRTTLTLVDKPAARAALPRVVELLAQEFGWDAERCAQEAGLADARLGHAF